MKQFILRVMILSISFITYTTQAQVIITSATGGFNICTNNAMNGIAPGPVTLDTLVIREANTGDFAVGDDTLLLRPPTGWRFWTGTATGAYFLPGSGGDITGADLLWANDSIRLHIHISGTAIHDTVFVYGIQVQPKYDTALPGYIYPSRATGFTGVTTGTADTAFGHLSVSPARILGDNYFCLGMTTFFDDATPGGKWTSTNTSIAFIDSATGAAHGITSGHDTIVYTLPNGCLVRMEVDTTIICEGAVRPLTRPGDVNIYPIPATDRLIVEIADNTYHHMAITNAVGQVLLRQKLTGLKADMDIHGLSPGIYILLFSGDGVSKAVRFVKW